MCAVPDSHLLAVTCYRHQEGIFIYDWSRRTLVASFGGATALFYPYLGVLTGHRIVFGGMTDWKTRRGSIFIADVDSASEVSIRHDLPPSTALSKLAVSEGGEAFVAVVTKHSGGHECIRSAPRHRVEIWRDGIPERVRDLEWEHPRRYDGIGYLAVCHDCIILNMFGGQLHILE